MTYVSTLTDDGFNIRWTAPDPAEQFSNPYLAMGNNPVMYVDPDGRIAFVPILVGMASGALIGAGTSAAIYSVQAGINGTWNFNDFGKTAAIGAVGGALGGGLGNIGAQLAEGGMGFGQSLGYNVLSNVASNSATTLAFGGDITAGGVVGMAVGGAIGAGIGNFQGVPGSAIKNIGAELGFGAFKGAVTGAYGGMIGAAIDGTDPGRGFINGARNGAIAGATVAGLNIGILGATYLPEDKGFDLPNGGGGATFRRGTFLWEKGTGMSFGNSVVTRFDGRFKMDNWLVHHEYAHYIQQQRMGFGEFYKRGLKNAFMKSPYDKPGTIEHGANIYSLSEIGYFYSHGYDKYIYPESYLNFYPGAKFSIFY